MAKESKKKRVEDRGCLVSHLQLPTLRQAQSANHTVNLVVMTGFNDTKLSLSEARASCCCIPVVRPEKKLV